MKTLMQCYIVGSFVIAQISFAQWEPIGPRNNPALHLASVNDSIVYVFGQQGLAKKMVIGENTWLPLPNPDGDYLIEQFDAQDSILFACSYHYQSPDGYYLLISTNSGLSWKKILVDTTIVSGYCNYFSSFEIIGSTLFAGRIGFDRITYHPDSTCGGLYISNNIGITWDKVSRDSLPGWIGKLKAVGSTLYSAGKGLHKSTDLGKSWKTIGLNDSILDMIEVKDSKILAGFRGFRSEMSGEYSRGQIYLSSDGGIQWKTIWSTDSTTPLAIAIYNNNLYMATSDNRILKSQDEGRTWYEVAKECSGYGSVTFLQHDSSLVVVFSNSVILSHDGENWRSISNRLGSLKTIVAFTPFGSRYIAGSNDGIHVSNDQGETWKSFDVGTVNNILKIGSSLLAGTMSGLLISEDTARSWSVRNPDLRQHRFAPMLVDGHKIITDGSVDGQWPFTIIASLDTGRTWSKSGNGFTTMWGVYSFAVIESTIFADAGYDGMYRSIDHGYSWSSCYSSQNTAILKVFAFGTNIFAGSFSGVLRSTDNGITWEKVYSYPVTTVRYSPRSFVKYGSNVIVGFDEGKIAYTPDSGNSWRIVESNLPNDEFDDLVISGNDIFALMWSSGLWRRPIAGMIAGVSEHQNEMPTQYSLAQNYPNPFNPSTTITFSIPERSNVRLSIFNTLGQKISEIVNEVKEAGLYEQAFNASQLSSGMYFYRIEATSERNSKTFVETKKMVLMR